jgi:hypothetical protein
VPEPNLAYKFTDEDVRLHYQKLHNAACAFLNCYTGDYPFLRDAAAYLQNYGYVETGVLRGVLNCMRTNTEGIKLLTFWTPELTGPRPGFILHGTVTGRMKEHRAHLTLVEPTRPTTIYPRCVFHAPYYMSTHKQAFIAHLLDPVHSQVLYYTKSGLLVVDPTQYCGSRLTHGVMSMTDMGRMHCRNCIRIRDERNS